MGCTSSREALLDGRPSSLPRRTNSMPIRNSFSGPLFRRSHHHHPPKLTPTAEDEVMMKNANDHVEEASKAKALSQTVRSRMLYTPSVTPPNEPEIINAWELMEGLEDTTENSVAGATPNVRTTLPSPQWMEMGANESVVSDFDQEILSSFRKALEEFSPKHPLFLGTSSESQKTAYHVRSQSMDAGEIAKPIGIVKARVRDFQHEIDARAKTKMKAAKISSCYESPQDSKGKVVFYFTSIRGVRKTYEECWAMRVILKGYGVRVDERDVSMHSGFKDELNQILGPGFGGNGLPRIFADGNYLGGAEELRHLHEIGELGKILDSCEMVSFGKGGIEVACEGCADVRFIPCETCSGSCKVFVEEEYDNEDYEMDIGSFQRCPDCNENGLVRCPLCC